MRRKVTKPKTKATKEPVLVLSGNETAAQLYTKYIATQDPKVREMWRAKYKEEKANK